MIACFSFPFFLAQTDHFLKFFSPAFRWMTSFTLLYSNKQIIYRNCVADERNVLR